MLADGASVMKFLTAAKITHNDKMEELSGEFWKRIYKTGFGVPTILVENSEDESKPEMFFWFRSLAPYCSLFRSANLISFFQTCVPIDKIHSLFYTEVG